MDFPWKTRFANLKEFPLIIIGSLRLYFSTHRYCKRIAAPCMFCNLDNVGEALCEFGKLHPKCAIRPARFQKEDGVPCLLPSLYFMRVAADTHVGRNNDPAIVLRQRPHPDFIRYIRWKFLLEMHDLMVRISKYVQTFGQFRREIVIKEKLHAASCRSYATASSTE